MLRNLLQVLVLILPFLVAYGQKFRPHGLILETPVIDFPYQWQTRQLFPSMTQSLQLTKSFFQLGSYGLGSATHFLIPDTTSEKQFLRGMTKGVLDVVFHMATLTVPVGHGWIHEEYHAIVGRKNGVHGKNLVNRFPSITSEFITVYDVEDQALITMKLNSNADFVRMSAAGLEGQTDLSTQLQVDQFFYKTNKALAQYWIIAFHNNRYIGSAAFNQITLDEDEETNEDVTRRDLVGWDPLAWVYDLFHPDEPYENRGPHPSGVGIDRYIVTDDLEEHELDYLQKQSRLATLNYLDPFLLGFTRFRVGKKANPFFFNANVKHFLTSFGHSIQTQLFLEQGDLRGLFKVLHFANYERSFIGFEARLLDLDGKLWQKDVLISPKLSLWSQPKNQEFQTTAPRFGGLLGLKLFFPLANKLWTTFEVESKTEGWVASNPYLDANTSGRIGIHWRLDPN